ncbi:DDE-type integrase/transposase/recombinase, partial [Roseomonas sp. GCM10028921]
DETYTKVRGRWCFLYRAIGRDGNLVDTLLREHRDMAAAQAFLRSARSATGINPRPRHHGRARLPPARGPFDAGSTREAPDERVPE